MREKTGVTASKSGCYWIPLPFLSKDGKSKGLAQMKTQD